MQWQWDDFSGEPMLILLKCSYNVKMIAVEACGDCAMWLWYYSDGQLP